MHHGCHNPIHCVMPPHMIEAIRTRGDDSQRAAVDALERSAAEFRGARSAATTSGQPVAALMADAVGSVSPQREVYDVGGGTTLPGSLERREGDPPTGDDQVDQAYDGAGDTYDLFLTEYGRNSLDGSGMTIVQTVHFGSGYDNAFWNGTQMVYGDGGMVFEPLTGDLAVIAHELSHGVVQFSGGLVYQDQSGALNEHVADVFGALTEQKKRGEAAHEADWLIGEGLLRSSISGVALRSMAAPGTAYNDALIGKDPQPYHMSDYVFTSSDNGGVHINSGIPNHAFYLLSLMLGGNAWSGAGKIWYETLQSINNPHARFSEWAQLTIKSARQLFGSGSREELVTERCWKLVGVL